MIYDGVATVPPSENGQGPPELTRRFGPAQKTPIVLERQMQVVVAVTGLDPGGKPGYDIPRSLDALGDDGVNALVSAGS
jgi:hypothetical protein